MIEAPATYTSLHQPTKLLYLASACLGQLAQRESTADSYRSPSSRQHALLLTRLQ